MTTDFQYFSNVIATLYKEPFIFQVFLPNKYNFMDIHRKKLKKFETENVRKQFKTIQNIDTFMV